MRIFRKSNNITNVFFFKNYLNRSPTFFVYSGRNFDEVIRVIDSLQLGDKHRITTPANWKKGDDVIVHPGVSNDEAEKLFPGFKTVKPYLRYAKSPF